METNLQRGQVFEVPKWYLGTYQMSFWKNLSKSVSYGGQDIWRISVLQTSSTETQLTRYLSKMIKLPNFDRKTVSSEIINCFRNTIGKLIHTTNSTFENLFLFSFPSIGKKSASYKAQIGAICEFQLANNIYTTLAV